MAMLVALSGVLIATAPAFACTCEPPPPPLDALEGADAVFAGEVVSIEESPIGDDGIWSSADPVTVTLSVDEVWKGLAVQDVTILTVSSGDSCGFGFDEDERYLVYAYRNSYDFPGKLSTHLCSRTRPTNFAAEDLAVLGEGRVPTLDEPISIYLPILAYITQ